jgi:Cu-Zn family superoxide dismutase
MSLTKFKAVAILKNNKGINGMVTFEQSFKGGPTHVYGFVNGLTEGEHGFHIHEYGDLSNGCTSAGAHFNPHKQVHGGRTSEVRHAGDYGNIISRSGESTFDFWDEQTSLIGPLSIIGRSVIIHADRDDLGLGNHPLSLTTGNSGDRVVCGVIGLAASV